jgi:hypothetical protein
VGDDENLSKFRGAFIGFVMIYWQVSEDLKLQGAFVLAAIENQVSGRVASRLLLLKSLLRFDDLTELSHYLFINIHGNSIDNSARLRAD